MLVDPASREFYLTLSYIQLIVTQDICTSVDK